MMLGLGASVVHPAYCDTGNDPFCGPDTDCSNTLNYMFAPQCWTTPLSEWQALAATPAPPMPQTVVPPAPTPAQLATVANSPTPGVTAQQLVNQLAVDSSSQTITQAQQANQQFFSGYADQIAAQNQINGANPNADCSGFLSFLDSNCAGSLVPTWVWVAALGIGGVLLVGAFRR